MTVAVERLIAPCLGEVPHGFLGRRGGVSRGLYASLNVGIGSGDDQALIHENRVRAAAAIASQRQLITVRQVHSARCMVADPGWDLDARPEADALVTDRPELLIGILTADCAPVLFADAAAGVVGAAHAGWKGALGGIVAATIDAMEVLGAQRHRIAAAVGPCIARRSYEVDENFLARFASVDPDYERFFSAGARAGHHQFDLEGFVAAQAAAGGVARIDLLGEDTYSQPDRFFSYRLTTHRAEPDYGRQLSAIGVAKIRG